jgi:heme-binding NEAT domain protein
MGIDITFLVLSKKQPTTDDGRRALCPYKDRELFSENKKKGTRTVTAQVPTLRDQYQHKVCIPIRVCSQISERYVQS